ncbi:hypothetical protein [Curtobacterium citreum]|uniref:hypothetical protein n=1 Tax=Curtobacterium citreum TaxID=2036 RepID=UPI002543B11F|nr:hypothetical protein [Curtobacterium citreum]WIJ45004.1 hypothetical protein QPK07_14955 [Curtobacterium citreum]
MVTRIRTAAGTSVALALGAFVSVGLTGCTQPDDAVQGVARAACEQRMGPAIVAWWRDQYDETPWKVVDTRGSGVQEASDSSSAATVLDVSGTSSVQRDEVGQRTAVRWSCEARYSSADPQTVTATVEEITLR